MLFRASKDKRACAWHDAPHRYRASERTASAIAPGFLKWYDHASLLRKQFLGVPVGCGDNCLAGSERDGECAGDDLRLMLVRRDVNIRRAHMLDKFLGIHKSIVENQVIGNAKLFRQRLQLFTITLAFAPANMRMSHSGDDINHVRLPAPESQAAPE